MVKENRGLIELFVFMTIFLVFAIFFSEMGRRWADYSEAQYYRAFYDSCMTQRDQIFLCHGTVANLRFDRAPYNSPSPGWTWPLGEGKFEIRRDFGSFY
jgi:hypothetical protein